MKNKMEIYKKIYLKNKARKLRRFLLEKGLEKFAEEGTRLDLSSGEYLRVRGKEEDIYNRQCLEVDSSGKKMDVVPILLKASEEYSKEFRRYVACEKLLRLSKT